MHTSQGRTIRSPILFHSGRLNFHPKQPLHHAVRSRRCPLVHTITREPCRQGGVGRSHPQLGSVQALVDCAEHLGGIVHVAHCKVLREAVVVKGTQGFP